MIPTTMLADHELHTLGLIRRVAEVPGMRVCQLTDGSVWQALEVRDGQYGSWILLGRQWPASMLREAAVAA